VRVAFQGDSGAFSQSAARIFFTDHGADSVSLQVLQPLTTKP